jgi:hypothetical protein
MRRIPYSDAQPGASTPPCRVGAVSLSERADRAKARFLGSRGCDMHAAPTVTTRDPRKDKVIASCTNYSLRSARESALRWC